MARIKLELPDKFDFSTTFDVRLNDINSGRHVGNDRVLQYANGARTRFKYNFYNSMLIEGVAEVVADAAVVYKSQAFYGQTLKIEVGVQDIKRKSCVFFYRITDADTGTEIARMKSGIVFFDYEKQQPVEVPAKFRAMFSS